MDVSAYLHGVWVDAQSECKQARGNQADLALLCCSKRSSKMAEVDTDSRQTDRDKQSGRSRHRQQTGRQTSIQTDRQTDRQRDKLNDRQTEGQDRQAYRGTDRQTDRGTVL